MKFTEVMQHYCASCTCNFFLLKVKLCQLLFFTVLCTYFLVHSAKGVSHGISTILLVKG